MNQEEILYLLPYLISLVLSLGILYYTRQHRQVQGAGIYAWYVAGQSAAIFGFILELITPNLEIKIIWDKFQWLSLAAIGIAYFAFAIEFTQHQFRRPRIVWGSLLFVQSLFTLLVFTDNLHGLIYSNPRLSTAHPFPELIYEFTTLDYMYSVYFYCVTLYGIGLIVKQAFQPENSYRLQYLMIASGFLIPIILSVFGLLGMNITPQRDSSPFTFALGNFIVAVGLFRFRLFDIVPVAREQTIENINDPVIVLDMQSRIVDMNPAALNFLKTDFRSVVGKSARDAFSEWTEITAFLENPIFDRGEIAVNTPEGLQFYDCSISPIRNRSNVQIGYIVIAHEITRQKVLENSYRILSEELDHRVKERTAELNETAKQYRAVVENQMEFIVRWAPNGKRTFVNEAYCRYFGTTVEQALSTRFMPLIVEEDRHLVEEKMQRLISGAVDVETDVHRVYRPDGGIGWQEWTEQAIRDENGVVVEIQSVGRDITERKLAEKALLNQLAFDEILTGILARFATCPYDEMDANIEIGLGEIAEFMGADHANIFLLSEDKNTWTITHRWLRLQQSNENSDAAITTGKLSWTEKQVLGGEVVKINVLDDYPMEAAQDRLFSETRGAKSLITLPIRGKGQQVFGCLNLISYRETIHWEDSNVIRLKMIGDVIANTLERKNAEEQLVIAYDTTLEGWAKALELKDKETEGHSRRVTETTVILAEAMGIHQKEALEHIRRGAILHDIGKMGVPSEILTKQGPLTPEEREHISKHPGTAYNLLKDIPYLEKALEIPYCHHEKWDGTGYPRGLKGEGIPLSARIFAVVDVWDALSNDRPYRSAWAKEQVIEYLKAETGRHFDPQVIHVFLSLIEQGRI